MPSVDVSQLAAFAQKYQKEIITQVFLKLEEQGITVIEDVSVALKFPKFKVNPSLQPYSSTFTGDGSVEFSDRELVVKDAKAEYTIEPYEFESTYLRLNRKAATDQQIPYENYFWQAMVEKIADEIVQYVIYYGDTTDVTAIKAYRITDGFKKLLAAAVVANEITPIVTGTPTSSNAVSKFELVFNTGVTAFPAIGKAKNLKIYASPAQRRNYILDYRTQFPRDTIISSDQENKLFLKLSEGKVEIIAADWLAGSNKLIMTPESNLIFGTNKLSDMNQINMVKKMWTYDTGIRMVMGLQIADTEACFINDAA